MKAIINATLVMRDHYIPDGVLLIEDGKITACGESGKIRIPDDCTLIDAAGAYVGPGFIDIHTHASDKEFFTDNPSAAAEYHLKRGTTTVFPALYFNMDCESYLKAVETIRSAMQLPECANIGGLYMEGPYLNPKFGCERESNPWKGPIRKEDYLPILEAASDMVKVWCLAPERENILEFVQDVRKYQPDAVFAVAHSEATPYEVEELIPYGLKIGTHHTNATGTLQKYPETRGVCVDEAVNNNPGIYAELICDSRGIHVDPYMLRLVRRIKGEDRIILISDAYACDGPVPPGYDGVNDINFDWTGEIAGSKLTLNVACRNMMMHTGASIVDVFRYASTNPAHAVGYSDRGEIKVGKRADLVIVDHNMNVQKVLIKGDVVQ